MMFEPAELLVASAAAGYLFDDGFVAMYCAAAMIVLNLQFQ